MQIKRMSLPHQKGSTVISLREKFLIGLLILLIGSSNLYLTNQTHVHASEIDQTSANPSPTPVSTAVIQQVAGGSEDTTTNTTSSSTSNSAAPSAGTNLTNSSSLTWTWSSRGSGTTKIYIGSNSGGHNISNGAALANGATSYTQSNPSDGTYYAYVTVETLTTTTTVNQITVGDFVLGTNTIINTNTNLDTSANSSGATVDRTSPTISNLSVGQITNSAATITWTTSEPTTTALHFGTSSGSYGSLQSSSVSASTSHAQTVSALIPQTNYYLQVVSTDPAGNSGNSAEISFATSNDQSSTPSSTTKSLTQTSPTPSNTPSSTTQPTPNASTEISAVTNPPSPDLTISNLGPSIFPTSSSQSLSYQSVRPSISPLLIFLVIALCLLVLLIILLTLRHFHKNKFTKA